MQTNMMSCQSGCNLAGYGTFSLNVEMLIPCMLGFNGTVKGGQSSKFSNSVPVASA